MPLEVSNIYMWWIMRWPAQIRSLEWMNPSHSCWEYWPLMAQNRPPHWELPVAPWNALFWGAACDQWQSEGTGKPTLLASVYKSAGLSYGLFWVASPCVQFCHPHFLTGASREHSQEMSICLTCLQRTQLKRRHLNLIQSEFVQTKLWLSQVENLFS